MWEMIFAKYFIIILRQVVRQQSRKVSQLSLLLTNQNELTQWRKCYRTGEEGESASPRHKKQTDASLPPCSGKIPLHGGICCLHSDNTALFSQGTDNIWNMFAIRAISKAGLAIKCGKSQFGPQSSNIWDIRWDSKSSCEINQVLLGTGRKASVTKGESGNSGDNQHI